MNRWSAWLLVLFVTGTMAAGSSLAEEVTCCDGWVEPGEDCVLDGGTNCGRSRGYSPRSRTSDRWFGMTRCLEERGIKFEGAVSQFYQDVASGGIEQKISLRRPRRLRTCVRLRSDV